MATTVWVRKDTQVFISLLRQCPTLYNYRHANYNNKSKRMENYEFILNELKKTKPDVTIKDIKQKIKTLKTQLNKERKKIINWKENGDKDEEYQPKLWCYHDLFFLENCNDTIPTTSEINIASIDNEILQESDETSEYKSPNFIMNEDMDEDINEDLNEDLNENDMNENMNEDMNEDMDENIKEDNTWNKMQTEALIREFRKYPCLYNSQDQHFYNRTKKNEKMILILVEISKIKEGVTLPMIRKKLHTLRSQMWRERKKSKNFERIDSDTDEINKPTLWCYDQLSFLEKTNDEVPSSSNINQSEQNINLSKMANRESLESVYNKVPSSSNISLPKVMFKRNRSFPSRRMKNEALEALQKARNFFDQKQKEDSKEDSYCKYLASMLKQFKTTATFHKITLEITEFVQNKLEEEEELRAQSPTGDLSNSSILSEQINFQQRAELQSQPIQNSLFCETITPRRLSSSSPTPTIFSKEKKRNNLKQLKVVLKKSNSLEIERLRINSLVKYEAQDSIIDENIVKDPLQLAIQNAFEEE